MSHDNFGEKLQALRDSRDLTQKQMSELVGVSLRYYQSLEAGEKNPSLKVLRQTLEGAAVSYDEFFGIEPPEDTTYDAAYNLMAKKINQQDKRIKELESNISDYASTLSMFPSDVVEAIASQQVDFHWDTVRAILKIPPRSLEHETDDIG